jgi:hypothetical protein
MVMLPVVLALTPLCSRCVLEAEKPRGGRWNSCAGSRRGASSATGPRRR